MFILIEYKSDSEKPVVTDKLDRAGLELAMIKALDSGVKPNRLLVIEGEIKPFTISKAVLL